MKGRRFLPRIFFLILVPAMHLLRTPVPAQSLDAMQHPPGLTWKSITTPHYEVIFPAEITADAERVANTLEHTYAPVGKTLGVQPSRLPVVLSNQTTISNGYVALGPRMSQWYSTPPQYSLLGTSDWFNLLATHEMRHVAQYDLFNTGATRVASWLCGDLGWNAMSFFAIPTWVWEGDAVVTETTLGSSGRGRLPEFDQEIRALLLSGRRYSYYKAYLNSYADHYPSVYNLGYLLASHLRRTRGADAWRRVLKRAAAWSILPGAFSIMMNDELDMTTVELYNETMDELDSLWRAQVAGLTLTDARTLTRSDIDCWTNYTFPQPAGDGSIIAQKYGMNDMYRFVRMREDGGEERLALSGAMGGPMSVRGALVAWNERRSDIRWGLRDYSVVRVMNTESGETRTLTHGSKLFVPAISPQCDRIAAVEFTPERRCAIVILDIATGAELRRIPAEGNTLWQTPAWSPDGSQLAAVKLDPARGKTITLIPLGGGATTDVLPWSFDDVSMPAHCGRYILHTSTQTGIDNIFAVDTATRARYQVTSRKFGARNAAVTPDLRTLYFNDYTAAGYGIARMPFDPSAWMPVTAPPTAPAPYCEPLVAQESGGSVLATVPAVGHPVRDYGSLGHLLDIHSWLIMPPVYDKSVSLTLVSRNVMNTFALQGGCTWDYDQHAGSVSGGFSYAGLFPIIDVTGTIGKRASTFQDEDDRTHGFSWNEQSVRAGLRVPLNFTSVVRHTLTLSADAAYTRITNLPYWDSYARLPGVVFPVTYSALYFYGYQWIREVVPAHAVQAFAAYEHMPFTASDWEARHAVLLGWLYGPGLFANHSAWLNLAWERQWEGNYHFARYMRFPRGYESRYFSTIWKTSLNYTMPIVWPDLHIWSLLNFKRVSGTVFFDYGEGGNAGRITRYQSGGYELLVDFNILALPFQLSAGVRGSYLFTDRKWVTETLVAIPMY